MGIYEELGMKPIINAAGTYTVLGGSRMSEETLEAMRQAAAEFIPIREFQQKIHAAIAKLTRNPAAYVPNGAAAGMYLAFAAGIQLRLGKRFYYLEKEDIATTNVVMFKAHRNPYDLVIRHLGAAYRELSFPNIILPPTAEDLNNAIDERTAAIYFAATGWAAPGFLPLEEVLIVAKRRGVPVVVDAAAQLPPVENLWKYTEMGAAATLFSGGKDLHGPQSAGLMVGQKDFLGVVTEIGFPNYGIGRMLKVGREEMSGMYSAVKQYVGMDHEARNQWCERQIASIADAFEGSRTLKVSRTFPNEAGQPIARAFVEPLDSAKTGEDVRLHLLAGDPPIYAYTENLNGVFINPMSLREGETDVIIQRLKAF